VAPRPARSATARSSSPASMTPSASATTSAARAPCRTSRTVLGPLNRRRGRAKIMSAAAVPNLRDLYLSESGQIRARFQERGDGLAAVRERSALVDSIAQQLYAAFIAPEPGGPERFCVAALGGFGRKVLFPGSDVDLLFLAGDARTEEQYKRGIANLCRELWDLRLRVSPTTRSLAECGRLYRDNLE